MSHRSFGARPRSRRDFLGGAAAVAGAAALGMPAVARSRVTKFSDFIPVRPRGDGEAVRIGIIGTGGMGTGHVDAFTNFRKTNRDNVELVGLADPWKENLNNALKLARERQEGVSVEGYADYRALLDRKDVQGVLIASPEHWHAQHAIDAIEAGKDVYLEKPMCFTLADAMRLYKVVKAHPERIFQVGTQRMRLPRYEAARKLVADGAIGVPTMSQTSYCRNSPGGEWNYYRVDESWKPGETVDWDSWCGPIGKQPWDPYLLNRWRRYKVASTGIVGDLLVHMMTPIMYALQRGWPTRVVAQGQHIVDKAMENHDTVNLTVSFEKEHTMIVAGATNNETGLEDLIRGHKANLYLNGRNCELRAQSAFVDDVENQTIECPDIGNDQDVHRLGWLASIRDRSKPASDVELGTQVMVIVDLATRSMWDGKAWVFDPATMTAKSV